ncbi:5-formyltetrahydrofolate cyclo-ligase [Pseudobacillus sp. FSL P4-0506]|uniref:5-formyltetrahydrofolate cyclo-ligase n=1 Tax=unclassified Pseudobacillus TaxID=2619284 RepID=UPI0030F8A2A6
MNKQMVRQRVKEELSKLDRLAYEQLSFQIARRLFSLKEWKEAKTVAVTVSNAPEVDTWQIIRQGWLEGKRMVVPKCIPAEKKLNFYKLTSFTELEMVYFGLYEPIPSCNQLVERSQMDLIIVPGLAFCRSGSRLGFGGGYYDRFLAGYNGSTVALAFSQQLMEQLPREPHDLPVQQIIAEEEVIVCESEAK